MQEGTLKIIIVIVYLPYMDSPIQSLDIRFGESNTTYFSIFALYPDAQNRKRWIQKSSIDANIPLTIHNILCLPQLSTAVVEYELSHEKYI